MTIAADPKRMGAKVGLTSVLHTWGSAMTHHPHIHMIVPCRGLSPDGNRWVACKPGFFLHVRVLSRLFRRLFLDGLLALHQAGGLAFYGDLEHLARVDAFTDWLVPFRKSEWVVYSKPPFGGPEAVLTYLSPYTHRVAISNHRLGSADANTVAFRWKDYRVKNGDRQKIMRLAMPEFIRRFLIHVLPPSRQIAPQSPAGQWMGSIASRTTACWPAASARQDLPKSVRCSVCSPRNRRLRGPRSQRSPHSPCVSHAPVAAGPCASSRSSAVGKNRCRARHHGSRPHDISPFKDH
jgi:hypothetical protein